MVGSGGASVHTHLTHASLGTPESKSQMAPLSVQPFLHAHGRQSLYFTTGCPFSP